MANLMPDLLFKQEKHKFFNQKRTREEEKGAHIDNSTVPKLNKWKKYEVIIF